MLILPNNNNFTHQTKALNHMNVEFLLMLLFDKVNMTMAECPFVFVFLFVLVFFVFLTPWSLLGSQEWYNTFRKYLTQSSVLPHTWFLPYLYSQLAYRDETSCMSGKTDEVGGPRCVSACDETPLWSGENQRMFAVVVHVKQTFPSTLSS